MDIIKELEKEQLKSDITPFNVGDTIRVYAKVVEGSRERLQMFKRNLHCKKNCFWRWCRKNMAFTLPKS